jgi:hypothetical protein
MPDEISHYAVFLVVQPHPTPLSLPLLPRPLKKDYCLKIFADFYQSKFRAPAKMKEEKSHTDGIWQVLNKQKSLQKCAVCRVLSVESEGQMYPIKCCHDVIKACTTSCRFSSFPSSFPSSLSVTRKRGKNMSEILTNILYSMSAGIDRQRASSATEPACNCILRKYMYKRTSKLH